MSDDNRAKPGLPESSLPSGDGRPASRDKEAVVWDLMREISAVASTWPETSANKPIILSHRRAIAEACYSYFATTLPGPKDRTSPYLTGWNEAREAAKNEACAKREWFPASGSGVNYGDGWREACEELEKSIRALEKNGRTP